MIIQVKLPIHPRQLPTKRENHQYIIDDEKTNNLDKGVLGHMLVTTNIICLFMHV